MQNMLENSLGSKKFQGGGAPLNLCFQGAVPPGFSYNYTFFVITLFPQFDPCNYNGSRLYYCCDIKNMRYRHILQTTCSALFISVSSAIIVWIFIKKLFLKAILALVCAVLGVHVSERNKCNYLDFACFSSTVVRDSHQYIDLVTAQFMYSSKDLRLSKFANHSNWVFIMYNDYLFICPIPMI